MIGHHSRDAVSPSRMVRLMKQTPSGTAGQRCHAGHRGSAKCTELRQRVRARSRSFRPEPILVSGEDDDSADNPAGDLRVPWSPPRIAGQPQMLDFCLVRQPIFAAKGSILGSRSAFAPRGWRHAFAQSFLSGTFDMVRGPFPAFLSCRARSCWKTPSRSSPEGGGPALPVAPRSWTTDTRPRDSLP